MDSPGHGYDGIYGFAFDGMANAHIHKLQETPPIDLRKKVQECNGYICEHCGAHLDPGEHCDCRESIWKSYINERGK